MRKNRNRPESDEPLSEGRVEYLEAARQRVRNRRIRRTAVLLVLLTAVVLFATGIAGSSVAALKDLTDTARIALLPGSGWPQQTGVAELEQMAPLTGSFVELGDEGCVVWSRTGKKLNSIQSGYARPALAAGKTRFVLYNRSGNELRVDADAMQRAAEQFVGKHDFLALCAAGSSAAAHGDTVRTITDCHVTRKGDEVDIEVTADGYLYNMVRILAGTLCEVGAGRMQPDAIPGILASRDRSQAGPTLPAKGLFLKKVDYDL